MPGGAEIDGGVGIEQPRDLRDVRRFSHEAMATVYEVYAVHADRQYAAQAAQATFDLVDRLERELSRFRPNSDITRINHLTAGQRTRVGEAQWLSRETAQVQPDRPVGDCQHPSRRRQPLRAGRRTEIDPLTSRRAV